MLMGKPADTATADTATTAKLSINLAKDAMAVLKVLAARRGVSVTETVRRAVAVLQFVEDEVAKGNTIAVLEPHKDGGTRHMREVLLLG